MKLINLNVEHDKHMDRVLEFFDREQPEVICLQETKKTTQSILEARGYQTTFLPRVLVKHNGEVQEDGDLLASRHPYTAETFYYHKSVPITFENLNDRASTNAQGCIVAHMTVDATTYIIATTHGTWTPDGADPNTHQQNSMRAMLRQLDTLEPHILCGDMNVPRHHNFLYADFLKRYQDNIPPEYASSLDQNIHRLGQKPELQKLFTDFMVDYVFTQEPYRAENVRLEFGISDHAAIVAEICRD